jgi:outer membrane receptor protein involved in Fe transport
MTEHLARNALTLAGAAALALAAAAAGAQEASSTTLGEVLVTAQKRTESVQDVPVSISVVSGSLLQNGGSTQLTDYSAYVPGMQVDSNGTPGQTTVSLRGIGPLGSSATVGTYVDDGPIGSSGIYNSTNALSFELMPYDIERIEVLRGPQGTLYGASSIGGLLKYVTVKPALDEFEGKAGIEAVDVTDGSGSNFNYGARISFPLVKDSLGMSLSYARRDLPAYVDNIQTGEKDVNEGTQEGARLALLWQPSENTSLALSAMRQEVDSDDNALLYEDINGVPVGERPSTNLFLDEPYESRYDLYSATLNVQVGELTLTSVTSYSEAEILVTADATRSYGELIGEVILGIGPLTSDVSYPFAQKKLTQEFRLTSPASDRFEWLVGAFYTDEDNEVHQEVSLYDPGTGELVPGLNPAAVVELPNEYQEYAAFVNGTYKFTDTFHLSAGVRYARNDQEFRQISFGLIVPTADVPGTSDEDVVTYSLSPEWHFSNDTMLYARVATGYRAGGPNVFLPGVPPTVDSDSMTDYEIGVKSTLAGGSVQLEAAVFYMDWKDIQLGVQFPNGTGGLANAGSAESQGIEGSLSWLAGENFTVGMTGAYTDAQLTSDTPNGGQDGDRLPRTPEWSGSLFADYVIESGENLTWQFGGLLRYVGDRISDPESQPNSVKADSYLSVDLNAGLTINNRWTLRAFARNVTDEDGDISRQIAVPNSSLAGGTQFISVMPLQPRTFGLGVEIAF